MRNRKKNIISIFLTEFIRIKSVIYWSMFAFGGFILGMSSLDLFSYIVPLFVLLLSTFCIMSLTFTINNYYDVNSDRENPKKMHINAIASGKISKKTGFFLNVIFIIIPLVVTFFFRIEVFIFCAFLLFLGWAYSAPPLRLKGRPVLDIIWHFLGFFSYVIWGSLIGGSIGLINWLTAISIGVFSCVGQLENHIDDYFFDKDSRTMTFAVWVGLNKSKTTLKIITIFHLIFLIPLILLYTLSYSITILFTLICIVVIGLSIGLIHLKQKKRAIPRETFFMEYLAYVVGGAVYMSVLAYHLCFLRGIPTLSVLKFIGSSGLIIG